MDHTMIAAWLQNISHFNVSFNIRLSAFSLRLKQFKSSAVAFFEWFLCPISSLDHSKKKKMRFRIAMECNVWKLIENYPKVIFDNNIAFNFTLWTLSHCMLYFLHSVSFSGIIFSFLHFTPVRRIWGINLRVVQEGWMMVIIIWIFLRGWTDNVFQCALCTLCLAVRHYGHLTLDLMEMMS